MTIVLILLILIIPIAGYAGFYFGKKELKKPLTEDQKEKLRRENEEQQWQKVFNYSEEVAIRGYKQ